MGTAMPQQDQNVALSALTFLLVHWDFKAFSLETLFASNMTSAPESATVTFQKEKMLSSRLTVRCRQILVTLRATPRL